MYRKIERYITDRLNDECTDRQKDDRSDGLKDKCTAKTKEICTDRLKDKCKTYRQIAR